MYKVHGLGFTIETPEIFGIPSFQVGLDESGIKIATTPTAPAPAPAADEDIPVSVTGDVEADQASEGAVPEKKDNTMLWVAAGAVVLGLVFLGKKNVGRR